MVYISKLAGAMAAASLLATVGAHPGEHHDDVEVKRQIAVRNHLATKAKRSLDTCGSSLKARELNARSASRRAQVVRNLREKRGITSNPKKFRRDLALLQEYEAINHNQTDLGYTVDTDETTIFSANTSCILTPEVVSGPYYVTGESIRKNVKEDLYSDGIDLYLEVQWIDVSTCEPVENVYVDVWNANATGVYSGISTAGNYAADGLDSTYLRGIQVTDEEGVVAFETIFPGHYDGRASHTHLLAHMNVTANANGTIASGNVTHIGQLFWTDEVKSVVEATYPYSSNTQAVTTNDEDMWDITQAGTEYDPFPEYAYLGSDITDGLIAWIQIGIDTTADYTSDDWYAVAAIIQADGGHINTDPDTTFTLGAGISGGTGGGNGTMGGNGTTMGGNGTVGGNTTSSNSNGTLSTNGTTISNGTVVYVSTSGTAAVYGSGICAAVMLTTFALFWM